MKRHALLFLAFSGVLYSQDTAPHIAFLYPAGGQVGTVVDVVAGGQGMGNPKEVHVTGSGVEVEVVAALNGHSKILRDYFKGLRQFHRTGDREAVMEAMDGGNAGKIQNFPGYRELMELEKEAFQRVAKKFYQKESRQRNRHLDQRVHLRLTIAPDALSGEREIRLLSWNGWSPPIRFQVGSLPEENEREPNDTAPASLARPLKPPFTINGQVMPGDVDRFRFHAKPSQTLVVRVAARALVPYLADAVPGWFQPLVTIFDSAGREVAFADDFRFDPDPVLIFQAPREGDYELRMQDAIYRGREDFVYRVAVSENPFVSHIFPLGASGGTENEVQVFGWNLPAARLALPPGPLDGSLARGLIRWPDADPSLIFFTRDGAVEEFEGPDRETRLGPALPAILNGRIAIPGEVDCIRFTAKAGDALVADLVARRLHSPLDALLRLFDAEGRMLAWSDDEIRPRHGLLTHDADPRLAFEVPKDGTYTIEISDVQGQGSAAHVYRLRLGPPQPDFAIHAYPSAINVVAGQAVPVTFRVTRHDDFTGPIDIGFHDAPAGLQLHGGPLPADCEEITLTLHASASMRPATHPIAFKARADCAGSVRTHPVRPVDAVTQAFILDEYLPAQSSILQVFRRTPPGQGTSRRNSGSAPSTLAFRAMKEISIPAGGGQHLAIRSVPLPRDATLSFELARAPAGVRLLPYENGSGKLFFEADLDAPLGVPTNLVILARMEIPVSRKKGPKTRRFELGAYPALRCSVVGPQ